MRKTSLVNNEIYHVYNRGVDKRMIFEDQDDFKRFIETLVMLNNHESKGGIFRSKLPKNRDEDKEPLVTFVSFCVLPNHFHFILKQNVDGGISKFMQKVQNSYTKYFNAKYDRSGSLFQGRFKSIHADDNRYLLRLFVYVNLNFKIHKLQHPMLQFVWSSWDSIINKKTKISKQNQIFLDHNIVTEQFKDNNSLKEFADQTLIDILKNKEFQKAIEYDKKI